MLPDPPLPLTAVFTFTNGGIGTLVVTFDRPLQPGPTASANWIAHAALDGTFATGPAGVVAGNTVTITRTQSAVPPDPPNRSDYLAVPADVIGLNGAPVATFLGFPTTFL